MKMEDAGEITIKLNLDTEEFDKNFEAFKNKLETVLGLNSVEKTPQHAQRITGTCIVKEQDEYGRQYYINNFLRAGWIILDSKVNEKGQANYLIGTTEPCSTSEEFKKIVESVINQCKRQVYYGY